MPCEIGGERQIDALVEQRRDVGPPQVVCGEPRDASLPSPLLAHPQDRLRREPANLHAAALLDRANQGAELAAPAREPRPDRLQGPALHGDLAHLVPFPVDAEHLAPQVHVGQVEARDFAAAQSGREAERQHHRIPGPRRARIHHAGVEQGRHLVWLQGPTPERP